MSWFKKKETLDGYSEDTHWNKYPMITMCRQDAPKGKWLICGKCGKKTKITKCLTAGRITDYCPECLEVAKDKLIAECPHHYLRSFEEYKEWKKKHDR